jgi:hypothetical protein
VDVEQLEAALVNRAVIDQAVGIPRARDGVRADEAFDRLRRLGQRNHRTLTVVAARRVQEVVARTRCACLHLAVVSENLDKLRATSRSVERFC